MDSDVEMVEPPPAGGDEVEEQEQEQEQEQQEQEQEHENDNEEGYSSESENSSDNASEDDVDKDLRLVVVPDDSPSALTDDPRRPRPRRLRRRRPHSDPMLVDPASTTPPPPPTSPLTAPPTSIVKPAPTQPKKPKSHHAPPPPPPPAPPPPMQTIRLEITLGGPDNYEVDVKGMAREEGLVWGDLGEKKYADDSSDGEDGSDAEEGGADGGAKEDKDSKDKDKDKKDADGDVEMDADGKPKPTKKAKSKKKSKATAEYYDTTDPFIDDSELAIDERTYFAQTKQKGFYVSSGEVALVRDKSPKKPKSKKKAGPTLSLNLPTASTSALKPLSTAGPKKAKSVGGAGSKSAPASKAGGKAAGNGKALGTKDSPIALEDDDESKADVFGFGSQSAGGRRASGKGKEKAEEGDGDEAAIAEGVNRMKGKWKERVSVNGAPISTNGGSVNGDGSVKEEDDVDDEVGKKRKRAGAPVNGAEADGTKKRKTVDIASFHPDLQVSIEKMKQAIAAGASPPNLKPLLAALSLQAITLDEYDDNFFSLMPIIFPYNKFTMSKLIKRTIFHEHTALLNQKQDEQLEQLRTLATEGFPKAQEEWEKSLQNYEEKRKEKALATANGSGGDPESVEGSTGPTRHGTEDPEAPGRVGSAGLSSAGDGKGDKDEKEGGGKEGPGKGGAHHGPPLKKYRMTEPMKQTVWQLVLLSNEICRLENEKNSLEGSVLQVSEQGLRKVLYQRIVAAFPDGWMSSGQISRDVSAMKKKYEKETADD
ncbi:hypothetical protein B0H14DRAFT_2699543 [Mycena olivaceomarginata]|nr:hypothetical protein B0H14DRAFT_2699543 [Mycena olivaceomarginata]